MATIIDLTQTILPAMPVYPGTQPPSLRQSSSVERDGFAETWLAMGSHTGTHVDAPAHMLPGAPTLDALAAAHFVGRACVVDVSKVAGPEIDVATLSARERIMEGCRFVLLHTAWSRFWGQAHYFSSFPVLSLEAARWLARRHLNGVGFDAISADPVGSQGYPNHLELFRAGLVIVENLRGLEALLGRTFVFSCFPLKFEHADGSPVRAVAIVDVH